MHEQLIARINGQDLNIINGSIEYKFDEVSTFSFSIPVTDIDLEYLTNCHVDIIKIGHVIKEGYIFKRPQLTIDKISPIIAKIECEDHLGELICYRPKINAQYQFMLFSDVLDDLITATGGDWVWVDVNAIVAEVNLDLRTKENLFGQISELVKSVPYQHMRYGGLNGSGQHILEIGYFLEPSLNISKGGNLLSLKQTSNFSRCYSEIEPYAEMGGLDTPITLEGVTSLPEYAANPNIVEFPIILLSDGSYVVQNSSRIDDPRCRCSLKRNFSVITPRSTGSRPTILERIYAGYALYLKSVRHLLNADDYEVYNADIIVSEIPKPGDRISVYSVFVEEPVFNNLGEIITYIETFQLTGDFRIHSVSYDLSQGVNYKNYDCEIPENHFIINVEFSTRDDSIDYDEQLYLYEHLERYDHYNYADQGCTSFIQFVSDNFDNTVIPDCSSGGAFDGYHITVDVPTCRPETANNVTVNVVVYLFGFPGHTATVHNIVQPVDIFGTAEACIAIDNGDHDITALPATAYVAWDFQFNFTT